MKLSIIIVNYNTKDFLKQVLESITMQPKWEIIVIDNGSKDDSVAMMKKEFPKIKLVETGKNLGFAGANNVGMEMSNAEYVILLNTDTTVPDGTFEAMLDYMDKHKDVAAITPKVVLADGAIDLACHRGMPTVWNSFAYFAKLEQLFPNVPLFAGYHQTYRDFETVHEIEATAGTAMLVRRKAIDEVGMLDERFFLYAEDLDWCKRFTDAGWKIVYFPKVYITHFKSQSGKKKGNIDPAHKKSRNVATTYFYDTMKQFYDKHYINKYPKFMRPLVHGAIELKKRMSLQ